MCVVMTGAEITAKHTASTVTDKFTELLPLSSGEGRGTCHFRILSAKVFVKMLTCWNSLQSSLLHARKALTGIDKLITTIPQLSSPTVCPTF